MVQEYVQQRQRICTLSQVVLQLTHFVVDVLRLLPSPSAANNNNALDYNSTTTSNTGSMSQSSHSSGGVQDSSKRSVTPIQVIAKQASWVLLSDETAFQVSNCKRHTHAHEHKLYAFARVVHACMHVRSIELIVVFFRLFILLQELFDLAMLTFEDSWKNLSGPLQLQQQQSFNVSPNNSNNNNNYVSGKLPGGAQCLSQCFSKTYGILHEIVHKVRYVCLQCNFLHLLDPYATLNHFNFYFHELNRKFLFDV